MASDGRDVDQVGRIDRQPREPEQRRRAQTRLARRTDRGPEPGDQRLGEDERHHADAQADRQEAQADAEGIEAEDALEIEAADEEGPEEPGDDAGA